MQSESYKITVIRNEPHPKAGQQIPREYYQNGMPGETYPLTIPVEILTCELTEEMWTAVRNACIEAAK